MSAGDLRFFTDASCDGTLSSVAVRSSVGGQMLKVVALLPPVSSQEAELFAGVLGLELLRSSSAQGLFKGAHAPARWNLDNPLLVSQLLEATTLIPKAEDVPSTKRLLDALLERLRTSITEEKLSVQHVKAHAGVRENELCDRACRWARSLGVSLLRGRSAAFCGAKTKIDRGEAWLIVNWSDREFEERFQNIEQLADEIITGFFSDRLR